MNRIFGFPLDISVKWLVIIIVMGFVQFGVFWEQFRVLNENVAEMKDTLRDGAASIQVLVIKDASQDADIAELKRRMNGHDRRR